MAKLQLGRFPISKNGYVASQFRTTTLWCSIGCAQMAKLQLGRFPISKNGYVVPQFRITTLWCSIGCAQMAKLQLGRFPISKNGYAVKLVMHSVLLSKCCNAAKQSWAMTDHSASC